MILSLFLALTPAELPKCRDLRVPRVHIAYALGDGGRILRSDLPRSVQGGMMGLSDRCSGPLSNSPALCHTLLRECSLHRFGGIVADFERSVHDDRLAFLSQLGSLLQKNGKRLYTSEELAVPEAAILICTALSGGTLRECLSDAAARYGAQRIALDCQRLAMDFILPCHSGEGTPLTMEELAALREELGAVIFFSEELCANYFTYRRAGKLHFVLFDTAETLRHKLRLGRERGIETAFFMYPEVSDLLRELFS